MSDRLDDAIDRAVREMLDVEPRADLRARVIAQLPAAGFRLRGARWMVAPIAAAALIALAVFVARREPAVPQRPIVAHRGDQHLTAELRPGQAVASVTAAVPVARRERVQRAAARTAARVVAAAADQDRNFTAIAALTGPSSIDVAGLDAPAAGDLPSFAPEPMSIRALDVSALPETPRERREE